MKDGGAFAPCRGHRLVEGLNQVFSKRVHLLFFPAPSSAATTARMAWRRKGSSRSCSRRREARGPAYVRRRRSRLSAHGPSCLDPRQRSAAATRSRKSIAWPRMIDHNCRLVRATWPAPKQTVAREASPVTALRSAAPCQGAPARSPPLPRRHDRLERAPEREHIAFAPGSAYGPYQRIRRCSADACAARIGRRGDRFGDDAMVSEGRKAVRGLGAALAAIVGRAKNCFAQGLTRSERARPGIMPDRRIAGSPDRRIAGSPDRRIAGSPDRRIAGSPFLRLPGGTA